MAAKHVDGLYFFLPYLVNPAQEESICTAIHCINNQAGEEKILKIFAVEKEILPVNEKPGTLLTDDKNALEITCRNGIIRLTRIQLEGKKKMDTPEFIRGLKDVSELNIT